MPNKILCDSIFSNLTLSLAVGAQWSARSSLTEHVRFGLFGGGQGAHVQEDGGVDLSRVALLRSLEKLSGTTGRCQTDLSSGVLKSLWKSTKIWGLGASLRQQQGIPGFLGVHKFLSSQAWVFLNWKINFNYEQLCYESIKFVPSLSIWSFSFTFIWTMFSFFLPLSQKQLSQVMFLTNLYCFTSQMHF
jgi:hypothetical protein